MSRRPLWEWEREHVQQARIPGRIDWRGVAFLFLAVMASVLVFAIAFALIVLAILALT